MATSGELMYTAGASFDPTTKPLVFVASSIDHLVTASPYHDNLLIAINEIRSEANQAVLGEMLTTGVRVLLDSGIYNLAVSHARSVGCTMDQALALPPNEIQGFDALWELYLRVVSQLGAAAWGYIKLDQGGRDHKRRTRTTLEAMGLRPIPVYHPFNDGWAYFDELATRYDRICVGNVVQAQPSVRKRLIATIWERCRAYPHLWVHVLGLTPGRITEAYPLGSVDSSTWLGGLRWEQGQRSFGAGLAFSPLPQGFRYRDSGTYSKVIRLSAQEFHDMQRNWSRGVHTWL